MPFEEGQDFLAALHRVRFNGKVQQSRNVSDLSNIKRQQRPPLLASL
jgi:hypothetical protein